MPRAASCGGTEALKRAYIVSDIVLYLVSILLDSVKSGQCALQAPLQLLALLCNL